MDQRASPEAGTTGQVTDLLLQMRGGNTAGVRHRASVCFTFNQGIRYSCA